MGNMDNPDDPWNFHQCKLCSYKTRFLHVILSHVRQHKRRSKNHRFICDLHSPQNYQCEKCQFQSDLKVLLTDHFDTVHEAKETQNYSTLRLRYCLNCDFQTYSSLILLNHANSCEGSSVNNSKRGRLQHTNRKNEFFQCSYCSYITDYKTALKSHVLWKHTPSDQIRWFKCKCCSYKTKAKTSLHSHILRKHNQSTEHQQEKPECRDNNCTPPSDTSLEAKLKNGKQNKHSNRKRAKAPLHTNQSEDEFFHCSHCSYRTKHKGSVKTHILWKHTPPDQISWFECDLCSYKFKDKYKLRRHVLTKHSDPTGLEEHKRFKCGQCDYKTVRSDHLGDHVLRKHTPSKQINWFKCEHCSFKTKYKRSRSQHMRTRHRDTVEPEKLIQYF